MYGTDDNTLHLGQYLKENYAGGGHRHAAGGKLTFPQFLTLIQNKSI